MENLEKLIERKNRKKSPQQAVAKAANSRKVRMAYGEMSTRCDRCGVTPRKSSGRSSVRRTTENVTQPSQPAATLSDNISQQAARGP